MTQVDLGAIQYVCHRGGERGRYPNLVTNSDMEGREVGQNGDVTTPKKYYYSSLPLLNNYCMFRIQITIQRLFHINQDDLPCP